MKRCLQMMLLQRTVLEDFPLFCPKCRQERIINARNFQIEIMIHQPLIGGNGVHGPVTDIQIVSEQMQKTKQRLTRILSENTGRSLQRPPPIQSTTTICRQKKPSLMG